MRALNHKIVRNKKNFKKNENLENKVFLGLTSREIDIIYKRLDCRYYHTFLEGKDIFLSKDYKTIYTECTNIENVEIALLSDFEFPEELRTRFYKIALMKKQVVKDIKDHQSNYDGYKNRIIGSRKSLDQAKNQLNILNKKFSIFKKYELSDKGEILFKFENVIAEDIQSEGDDIDLGTLVFASNLKGNVTIIEGTHCHSTPYNTHAFHPHHLRDMICLGSQEVDFAEAMVTLELDIAQAILHKFAHSYNSNDGAGEYWKRWANKNIEDDDEDYVYVPSREDSYPEHETRFSNFLDEHIHRDDAVWSNFHDSHMLKENCIEIDGDYIDKEDTVELHDGTVVIHTEEIKEYKDKYYLKEDCIEIDGKFIPKEFLNYSEEQGYTLIENLETA